MSSYWQRRQQRADRRLDRDERDVEVRVRDYYNKRLKELERDISSFYAQYGKVDVLEYRDTLQVMDDAARKLLIEDCDQFLELNPWAEEFVNIRKGIYKLDRLEGLKTYARLRLAQAETDSAAGLDKHFEKVASTEANAVTDTFGTSFHVFDDQAIRQFVGQPWSDGKSYSERLWDNTEALARYVEKDLTDALIRGDSYSKVAAQMQKRFGQGARECMRVVRTEGTYVARQAQGAAMEEQGVTEYTIDAVGDERTCNICGTISGETFTFEEAVVGENYPPLHPNCRCQINPAVEDWDEWLRKRREDRRSAEKVVQRLQDDSKKLPKVAGFSAGVPMGFDKANGGRVNPGYASDHGRQINCQSCVVAYEARRRGYSVQVRSRSDRDAAKYMDALSRHTNWAWADEEGNPPEYIDATGVNTAKKCLKWLRENVVQGGRYHFGFAWKGRGQGGHIVTIERDEEGTLRLCDPQVGESIFDRDEVVEVYTEEQIERRKRIYGARSRKAKETKRTVNRLESYLGKLKYGMTRYGFKFNLAPELLRVDELEFNPDYVDHILEEADATE